MAYCSHCGTKIGNGAQFCPQCGNTTDCHHVYIQQLPQQEIYVRTRKSKGVALLLCFFLGGFGAHKFYLHSYLWGTLYLLFCWTLIPLLWSIVDFILILITPENFFHRMYDK